MRVPELKAWLQEYNLTPKKSFGQHFLCHEPILEAIAASVLGPKVLEIGPGPGCLTWYLMQVPDREVVMIEKDPKFQALLQARLPRAQWIHGDALELNWSNYAGFSVVSNLPYNISVPIMLNYAENAHQLGSAVFMMQKEVAERVMAKTHTKDYGRLSVMLQTYVDIRLLLDVPPRAFWPKPSVDSTVLMYTPKNPWPDISFKKLSSLVAQSFASRRQMLHHNVHIAKEIWAASGIDSRRRAETLEAEEFAVLLRTISAHAASNKERAHVDTV
jgi:16S rRNA (adenine1518-N6/adenine1519-N6)-dimethyltransferase